MGSGEGPEYETTNTLGAQCDVADMNARTQGKTWLVLTLPKTAAINCPFKTTDTTNQHPAQIINHCDISFISQL